jgi:peptidoglycan lytic transglycosylase
MRTRSDGTISSVGNIRGAGLIAIAVLLLAACARTVVTSPPRPPTLGGEETGLASWYGYPFHGRPTASGEVYDLRDLTAAHRTLPLGTRVLVTNVDNGQIVEVRVNDRGPFVDGRILDLSYGAARILGGVESGVIPVRIQVLALPGSDRPIGARPAAVSAAWSVQLGAFTSRARADGLREAVERDGGRAAVSETVVRAQTMYRVRMGPYPDQAAAAAAAQRLAARGYLTVVVPER